MSKQFIRICKWREFQHYKDRSPPWIKLHKSLLASETWVSLDDTSRVLAVACMLLAADTDNKTAMNPTYIKRVAYLNDTPNFKPLLDCGFIEIIEESGELLADASTVLANRTECSPEERRAETEEKPLRKRATRISDDFSLTEAMRKYATDKGIDPDVELESFKNRHTAKGSTFTDWSAAWRTWIGHAVQFGKAKNSQPELTGIVI